MTYIWVTSNSFDNFLVKMSRIAKKTTSDVVRMSQSAECYDGELGSFG